MTPDISAIAQKLAGEVRIAYSTEPFHIADPGLEAKFVSAIEEATASLRAQLEELQARQEETSFQLIGAIAERVKAEGERDVALAALKALFGATLNEMAARNLPEEWTADSPMADAAKLLGVAQESPLNGKAQKEGGM